MKGMTIVFALAASFAIGQAMAEEAATKDSVKKIGQKSVFKWVDERGQVHFSDRPAKSGERVRGEDTLRVRSGASDSVSSGTPGKGGAQDKEDMSAAERKDAELRAKECDDAKAAVAKLRSGDRIYTLEKTGDRKYLDEKEIAQRLKQAEDIEKSLCAPKG